jgi:hypothetical protein
MTFLPGNGIKYSADTVSDVIPDYISYKQKCKQHTNKRISKIHIATRL